MLEELKLLANKRDVPYQSLLKVFLAGRIARQLRLGTRAPRANQARRRPARATAMRTG